MAQKHYSYTTYPLPCGSRLDSGLADEVCQCSRYLSVSRNSHPLRHLKNQLELRRLSRLQHDSIFLEGKSQRVTEITGIVIPEEVRIDRIFSRYGFDRQRMESICRDFAEYVAIKRELGKKWHSDEKLEGVI